MPSGRSWQSYLNPERDMPEEAFAVHGLSVDFLMDKPLFGDVAEEFLTFVGDATLVIHNAAFDLGFINAELDRADRPALANAFIDTVTLARRKFPGQRNSLDALCERLGIDNAHRTKHGALLDAELLAEVYIELNGGRQRGLDLAAAAATSTTAVQAGLGAGEASVTRETRARADVRRAGGARGVPKKISEPIWPK